MQLTGMTFFDPVNAHPPAADLGMLGIRDKNMKTTTAHILMAIGIVWIIVNALAEAPIARGVCIQNNKNLPEKEYFSRAEVNKAVSSTAVEILERKPNYWIPTVIMLCAYIVLLRQNKRAQQPVPGYPPQGVGSPDP
jgi:hypothetical protein